MANNRILSMNGVVEWKSTLPRAFEHIWTVGAVHLQPVNISYVLLDTELGRSELCTFSGKWKKVFSEKLWKVIKNENR